MESEAEMSTQLRELILLGAGASVEAGMPTAAQAPNVIREILKNNGSDAFRFEGGHGSIKTLDYVTSRLNVYNRSPDIEEIFRCIDALHHRNESSLLPFIGSWDPDIDSIDGDVERPKYRTGWLYDPVANPSYGGFIHLKSCLIRVLDALTWLWRHPDNNPPHSLDYLRPLVRHAAEHKTWLVTLNYDPFVERAAQRNSLSACLGIETLQESRRLDWDTKSFNLIKLHGSFDWYTDIKGFHYEDDFGRLPPSRPNSHDPMILYGEHAKFNHYGPFPDLFVAFKQALTEVERVTVIGFSFRDEHITECLYQWLQIDPGRTIRIANGPSFLAEQLPKRLRDSYFTDELAKRAKVHPLRASEAIWKWYSP
jgi:hypothetical protein